MDNTVDENEAADRIEEMIHDCADNGTRYQITRNGEVVAYLLRWGECEELMRKTWMYDGLDK